jgi:hypothetical protein
VLGSVTIRRRETSFFFFFFFFFYSKLELTLSRRHRGAVVTRRGV